MKLKKLVLYGFKSFAERTVFEFEDSLSALVGPNGSGKSNVVDALRWVLGERSAQKLRGAEMVNVIFDGSKSHKPRNFADVALTIDNAGRWLPVDYEEVCIRRRVDRTGQSDYTLNGRTCRLKDIRTLLLDTGVGTSSYNFIEQGQIDRLLRSSPKERRGVFEEAAGISRFLDQKREAERKLERVGQNLARAHDILEEVARQLRSVKYQAARARTYKRHVERLQRLGLAEALNSHRQLTDRQSEQGRQIATELAEKARLANAAAAADGELEAARADLQAARDQLADTRERLTRIEARLESLARETELNHKRHEEVRQALEGLSRRQQSLAARVKAVHAEIEAAADMLEQSSRELNESQAASEAAHRRMERLRRECRDVAAKLDAGKNQVFDLLQREAHLKNQVAVLAAEKRTLGSRLLRLENRRRELQDHLRQAEGEQSGTCQELQALQTQHAALAGQMAELRRAVAQTERALEEVASRQMELRSKRSGKIGRRDVLLDLEARAEGLQSGARGLLEARLPGTVGLLADMLQVPLDLAPAVEAALGDRAQAVIFETAEQAVGALHLLAEESAGRAELIVLEKLGAVRRLELPPPEGVLGRLSELIIGRSRAEPVIEAILGNTFLVGDSRGARALFDNGLPTGARLVTPAGELFGADGFWSAGKPETPSLISRRSELAALNAQIIELQQGLAHVNELKLRRLSQLNELNAAREEMATRIEELSHTIGDMRGHLQAADRRAADMREELRLSGAEQTAIRQDIETADAQAAQLAEQSTQARDEVAALQNTLEAEQQRLRSAQEAQQALGAEANELSGRLARARERNSNLQALLERLRTDGQQRQPELEALSVERENNLRRGREVQRALESGRTETQALETERDQLRGTRQAKSSALAELQQRITALAQLAKQAAREGAEAEERLQELRIAANETSVRLQGKLERVVEDFGVRLQLLEQEPESWRDDPPFTNKLIREFTDHDVEPPPAERVAAWYAKSEDAKEEEREPESESPQLIALEEAARLRREVLELADDDATDWQHVSQEVAQLRARVRRVGNVNVAAIREQEQLAIRHQFLTDQKEDLEKARRHEREIIRELNKKSRERFRETFEAVRRNFQTLFRKLFGGGTADLVLDQEQEDILEAGIEVFARPPGKETSTISLLSGGEKALTTVALLFAMFQAKPSPFCILDEVDAPLDDSNVERFLMMLDEFRGDTQFIIITHNKMTMGVAQVLYGLTMADGVSKKISVKFADVETEVDEQGPRRARAG